MSESRLSPFSRMVFHVLGLLVGHIGPAMP